MSNPAFALQPGTKNIGPVDVAEAVRDHDAKILGMLNVFIFWRQHRGDF